MKPASIEPSCKICGGHLESEFHILILDGRDCHPFQYDAPKGWVWHGGLEDWITAASSGGRDE